MNTPRKRKPGRPPLKLTAIIEELYIPLTPEQMPKYREAIRILAQAYIDAVKKSGGGGS